MEQKAHETLISHIFELFDTGEEAISFLSGRGLGENRYLLRDLEALCAAIASAIGQLAPEITLENKLREVGLNAPLTLERIGALLDRGQADAVHMLVCAAVSVLAAVRGVLSAPRGVPQGAEGLVCPGAGAHSPDQEDAEAG